MRKYCCRFIGEVRHKMKRVDKIIGERIFLEALDHEEFSVAYVEWMRDEEVLRYLTGRTKAYSHEELKEYIAKTNENPSECLFGIFLKESGVHIGNIKIGGIDPMEKTANVGLLIGNKSMRGKGYATEAIELITRFAFDRLNLTRLTAGMVADNIGSFKAFIKAGYEAMEHSGRQETLNGRIVDIKQVEKCTVRVS